MKIAVINSGSSSLKYKFFDMDKREVLHASHVENIGEKNSQIKNHHDALDCIEIDYNSIDVIAHRVVHGAEEFSSAVLIDENVINSIKKFIPLAPLHNPSNLEGILSAKIKAPNTPQVAVFDTAFHQSMPEVAYRYALDAKMYKKHHIRRYGFHGTSHSYVTKEAAKVLNKDVNEVNLITLHLGNGASVCAIQNGKSIDTSMGFTPLEGLIMGTRSGDLDPAIIFYMHRELGMDLDEIDKELNKNSGLQGICNKNDVREILQSDDADSRLAIDMMVRRIQKYIGSFMALLESVDAIVFTGGIGENSEYIRERVMDNKLFKSIKLLTIKTDEELEIATQAMELILNKNT